MHSTLYEKARTVDTSTMKTSDTPVTKFPSTSDENKIKNDGQDQKQDKNWEFQRLTAEITTYKNNK